MITVLCNACAGAEEEALEKAQAHVAWLLAALASDPRTRYEASRTHYWRCMLNGVGCNRYTSRILAMCSAVVLLLGQRRTHAWGDGKAHSKSLNTHVLTKTLHRVYMHDRILQRPTKCVLAVCAAAALGLSWPSLLHSL